MTANFTMCDPQASFNLSAVALDWAVAESEGYDIDLSTDGHAAGAYTVKLSRSGRKAMLWSKARNAVALAVLAMVSICHTSARAQGPVHRSADFDAGYQLRAIDIRSGLLESQAGLFDSFYDFSSFVMDGMLPPAIKKISGPVGNDDICSGNRSFAIILQAQPYCTKDPDGGSCTSVHWRDFLMAGLPNRGQSSPKHSIESNDFKLGRVEADRVALKNFERLNEIYIGMKMYRILQTCGAVPDQQLNKLL